MPRIALSPVHLAFVQLHLSILLAGFTSILGKMITLSEGMLVWYRQGLTVFFLAVILLWGTASLRIGSAGVARLVGAGILLCLHWLLFYASIKTANVSIAVVCFALVVFFTAILEPALTTRRFSWRELILSLVVVLGIACIFSFDVRYRLGIGIGVVSSLLATLYTIANKQVSRSYNVHVMLFYQMSGGFLFLSCLLPFYLDYFMITHVIPDTADWLRLLFLSLVCTVGMYTLLTQALRYISAFTVNLSYNLETVYSIIIAILFLDEGQELSGAFYFGLAIIALSVAVQSFIAWKEKPDILHN